MHCSKISYSRKEKIHDSARVGSFVINLAHCTERLAQVVPLLEALPYPLQRIEAIYGKEEALDAMTDRKTHWHYFAKEMGAGTLGCALSHIQAWRAFLDTTYDFALICEDDIDFNPAFLAQLIAQLIKDHSLWDICAFQLNHRGCPLPLKKYGNWILSLYLYSVTGAGCYLMNREAAQRLLAKALPIGLPVDHYYTSAWKFPLYFTGIEPRPVIQRQVPSEIEWVGRHKRKSCGPGTHLIRSLWIVRRGVIQFFYNLWAYIRLLKRIFDKN